MHPQNAAGHKNSNRLSRTKRIHRWRLHWTWIPEDLTNTHVANWSYWLLAM